jgi:hypothetical protein
VKIITQAKKSHCTLEHILQLVDFRKLHLVIIGSVAALPIYYNGRAGPALLPAAVPLLQHSGPPLAGFFLDRLRMIVHSIKRTMSEKAEGEQ